MYLCADVANELMKGIMDCEWEINEPMSELKLFQYLLNPKGMELL